MSSPLDAADDDPNGSDTEIDGDPAPAFGAAARFISVLRQPPRSVRVAATVVGVVGFVVIAWWSVGEYRDRDLDANLWLLAAAGAVGTPLAIWLNALELRVIARRLGQDPSVSEASVVSLIASSANVLPLPGSVLIRTWFLARGGAAMSSVVRAQVVAGVTFVSVTLVLGGLLLAGQRALPAVVIVAVGSAGIAAMSKVSDRSYVARLAVVEAGMVASEVGRLLVVFAALGLSVELSGVAPIVVANATSAAIGIFPAGIGVREALAGAIAWVADTDVALTVATSTTDRLATTLMLAVMLLALSASGVRQRMVSQMEEGS